MEALPGAAAIAMATTAPATAMQQILPQTDENNLAHVFPFQELTHGGQAQALPNPCTQQA